MTHSGNKDYVHSKVQVLLINKKKVELFVVIYFMKINFLKCLVGILDHSMKSNICKIFFFLFFKWKFVCRLI